MIQNKNCAVFVPGSYDKIALGRNPSDVVRYMRQKTTYVLEKEIRNESVAHFILNLMGFPALDTAEVLIKLRDDFPHVALEFIRDPSQIHIGNRLYRSRHDELYERADVQTAEQGYALPPEKYRPPYPPHYLHAVYAADRIVLTPTGNMMFRLMSLACLLDKPVTEFNLSDDA